MTQSPSRKRARELGLYPGILKPGRWNGITDVPGVRVGHCTLNEGDSIRTGVTIVVPHEGNLFQEKVPAAVYLGNGFGKMTGYPQIRELGNLESPVALTNTLSVGAVMEGLVRYTLACPGNEEVRSVNAVVGETNDGELNDIRGLHVRAEHLMEALAQARSGPVEEGAVGAGMGTCSLGWKAGIGTSSRQLDPDQGGYVVGVLVQSNYGGQLTVCGVPVGRELRPPGRKAAAEDDGVGEESAVVGGENQGSCMIVVATDAPLDGRNLERLAKRAILGLGLTGSCLQNGSGDMVIAFSTAYRIQDPRPDPTHGRQLQSTGKLTNPAREQSARAGSASEETAPADTAPADTAPADTAPEPKPEKEPENKPPTPGTRPEHLLTNAEMNPLFLACVEATEEALLNALFMAQTVQGVGGNQKEALPLEKVVQICQKAGQVRAGETQD